MQLQFARNHRGFDPFIKDGCVGQANPFFGPVGVEGDMGGRDDKTVTMLPR